LKRYITKKSGRSILALKDGTLGEEMLRKLSSFTWKFILCIAALALLNTYLSYINTASVSVQQSKSPYSPLLYFQPNITPLFTELYEDYSLQHPPSKTLFDEAIYLDQSTPVSILPLQPSNQAVFKHTSDVLTAFHKKVGDFELYVDPNKPSPLFYTASGSKQLIVALVYAIVMSEPNKKFLFVEKSPFYSGHPNAVSGIFHYPNARFLAFHEPSEIALQPGEELVEFVTSPNNPDGKFRKPLTDARIIIADFVFASSAFGSDGTGYLENNLEWLRSARAADKHVFSFNSASKQFGKTGARCGYIWYPIYDPYAKSLFKNFFGFISSSTVAAGTVGLANFLDLIEAFLDMPDTGAMLRQDAKKSLEKRHTLIAEEFVKRYPGSTTLSIPGSPTYFAKVMNKKVPDKKASELLFDDLNISVNSGDTMGETAEFVRLNLCSDSASLVELLNRLAGEKKYTAKDVFFSSKQPSLTP
jgi:aspartate/methionine/tyrosine aminotransferase